MIINQQTNILRLILTLLPMEMLKVKVLEDF